LFDLATRRKGLRNPAGQAREHPGTGIAGRDAPPGEANVVKRDLAPGWNASQ